MKRFEDELYIDKYGQRSASRPQRRCAPLCRVLSWVVAVASIAFLVLLTVWLASLAKDDVVVSVNNVSVSAHEVLAGVETALSSLTTNTSRLLPSLPESCAELGLQCPETLTGVQTATIACGAVAGNGLLILFLYWMCYPRKEVARVLTYPEL